MENKIIVVDTCVFIDFFRKTKKETTLLNKLIKENYSLHISVITHFEILRGVNEKQENIWIDLLKDVIVLSYFPAINYTAIQLQNGLKIQRKSISFQDLIVASTAVHFDYPLATFNTKHFKDIANIRMIPFE